MIIHFDIEYSTYYGQQIQLSYNLAGEPTIAYLPLQYNSQKSWRGTLVLNLPTALGCLQYSLVLINEAQAADNILLQNSIQLEKYVGYKSLQIIHNNAAQKPFLQISNTKAFEKIVKQKEAYLTKVVQGKIGSHTFKIAYPLLADNLYLCMVGSALAMQGNAANEPLLFERIGEAGILQIDLIAEQYPVEYKVGVYNASLNKIVAYTDGENKMIVEGPSGGHTLIYEGHNFIPYLWRGAGINVPLFSIHTANSWGCGDFYDLQRLVDFASASGIKLIQLLPINDTTASYNDTDSYPYSAISSFALHPKHIDVASIAAQYCVNITPDEVLKIEALNCLPYCNHSHALALKLEVLKRIFYFAKTRFVTDNAWLVFFDNNKYWLQPYALFCVSRDKYGTPNYALWGDDAEYATGSLLKQENGKIGDDVLFWYFVQHLLHVQLQAASSYAAKANILLKADLPIGVGRYSADTWQHNGLFNMDMQAGAPPDEFSSSGQNWSFPTYNIPAMQATAFEWFKKRMQYLQFYFDAVRIDHVLGLFRIWSIPLSAVDGSMGIFVPALPLANNIFDTLQSTEERLCKPYITEQIVTELFGEEKDKVAEIFLDNWSLKPDYNTQVKILNYITENPAWSKYKQALFLLSSNVILLNNKEGYHCRINVQQTTSYKALPSAVQALIDTCYHNYFFNMQNELWKIAGIEKLTMLKNSTSMLLCAEDLGLVPYFTAQVLNELHIICLQVLQMPNNDKQIIANPAEASYATVVMPATHDMAPIRLWWEQNKATGHYLIHKIWQMPNTNAYYGEPWVCKKIIDNHLQSPAMWSIFLMQDWLSMFEGYRIENPSDERINDPANPAHVWNYKMPKPIEQLLLDVDIIPQISVMIKASGR